MSNVVVIGGGAAGMMAAVSAAGCGHKVHILEKNEKLGKKLFITGKGRCNVTNACEMEELFSGVITNSKFMYSSFYTFSNEDTIAFFEKLGLPLKIERGNRVFPVSDHSSDVIAALKKELLRLQVKVSYHAEVQDVVCEDGAFCKVVLADGREITGDSLIIATGGTSYKTTGSTGDGYRFAREMGHKVITPRPALVPLVTKEDYIPELMGLSLRNVLAEIFDGRKKLYSEFGEMLFTHYGVSGPLMLSASSYIGKHLQEKKELKLVLDLKNALSNEQLDARLQRDFEKNRSKHFKNALADLFPSKLIPIMVMRSGIDPEKIVSEVSKAERQSFVNLIKHFDLTITGLRGFEEAIITSGGVSVKEVDPSTMESKLMSNVYFAGEVLDLDALTGGYNLQIAWSTAYLAGISIT